MTDNDIKNVYIYPDQLKKVDSKNKHHLRFRVVTEDLRKTSAWSPIYKVSGAAISNVTGSILSSGDVITFAWGDVNARPEYDIFISTSSNGGSTYTAYSYHGTTPIHTYSILKPAGVNRIKFIVQVASYDNSRSYDIEVYPRDSGAYTQVFSV
jgi:hypothetical protein